MSPVRIAVAGVGLIGRRHIELVRADAACELVAVADPVAPALDVPVYPSLPELCAVERPDGVIVATPNRWHVRNGLACVDAGVPVLVEKPIADTVADAEVLVKAAEEAGVPLLVGHHRRHSPILARAREIVHDGVLGQVVAVQGSATFAKPDDYFEQAWRREPGGGPILINLSHEIDNLRDLCGNIVAVQAQSSHAARGFDVADTAAVTLRFASGALGTFLLSDVAASGRSWEQTSRENPRYPSYPDEDCYVIAGTHGSLSVPTMRLRVVDGSPSWWEPMRTSLVDVERADPLARQLAHFRAVITGTEPPLVSGREGLATLRATQAVADAASTGDLITL